MLSTGSLFRIRGSLRARPLACSEIPEFPKYKNYGICVGQTNTPPNVAFGLGALDIAGLIWRVEIIYERFARVP